MNLFNCFQAVGFYTAMPFLIQWLFSNQYNGYGYVACFISFVGYCMLSCAVHEAGK